MSGLFYTKICFYYLNLYSKIEQARRSHIVYTQSGRNKAKDVFVSTPSLW